MDTAVDEIGKLNGFCGRKRRGRCIGHIVNLSAKGLLFGHHPEAMEDDDTGEIFTKEEWLEWSTSGPVSKLHKLVWDIHTNEGLRKLFRDVQCREGKKALKIVRDNDTRWLSQYYMMKRGLKLRKYFSIVLIEYREVWNKANTTKNGNLRKNKTLPRIFTPECELTEKD